MTRKDAGTYRHRSVHEGIERYAMKTKKFVAGLVSASIVMATVTGAQAGAVIVDKPVTAGTGELTVEAIGTHETGEFEKSAAEIVAYDRGSHRLLIVNALSGAVTIVDISDPTSPKEVGAVHAGADTTVNSVSVRADGLAIATVEPATKTDPGEVILFDAAGDGTILQRLPVGALPDMVTFDETGAYAAVANEGEPAEDYSVDPEGSVSVISIPGSLVDGALSAPATVSTATFGETVPEGVRIFGPESNGTTPSVAANLEPEYIAVKDAKAYVTLQENNAIATVDVATATVENIMPLGTVDLRNVGMDVSDKDDKINIAHWPVKSFLLPDSIGVYTVGGSTYLVTANEGDGRDWDGYSEEARVKDLGKDGLPPLADDFEFGGAVDSKTGESITTAKQLQEKHNLGRLKITTSAGLNEDGTAFSELYTFGGRGFSIFDTAGNRVFNSDSEFEEILARTVPEYFNSDHVENEFDSRSDAKGPEAEGLVLGMIGDKTYAFIGLERIGGIMVYDITTPAAAHFVSYINNRDFSVDPEEGENPAWQDAGDLGPEGLTFIPAKDSPNGKNLLVVGNEVSGTTTIFTVKAKEEAPDNTHNNGNTTTGADSTENGGLSTLGTIAVSLITSFVAVLTAAIAAVPQLQSVRDRIASLFR